MPYNLNSLLAAAPRAPRIQEQEQPQRRSSNFGFLSPGELQGLLSPQSFDPIAKFGPIPPHQDFTPFRMREQGAVAPQPPPPPAPNAPPTAPVFGGAGGGFGESGGFADAPGFGGFGGGTGMAAGDTGIGGGQGFGGGEGGGGGKVICAELYRRGLMKQDIFLADEAYGEIADPEVIAGYHRWGRSVVRGMKYKPILYAAFVVATPVARELASRIGVGKGSLIGKALLFVGEPICKVMGKKHDTAACPV